MSDDPLKAIATYREKFAAGPPITRLYVGDDIVDAYAALLMRTPR